MRALAPCVAVLSALVLSACGSDDEPSARSQSASATPANAAKPFPTVEFAELTPGTAYRSQSFKPRFTLTLPDGEWSVVGGRNPDHLELEPEVIDPVDDAGIGFHHMTQVFDPDQGGETPADAIPGPDDFAAWLTEHPHLKTTEPEPVEAMGLEGVSIDVTVRSGQRRLYKDCGKVAVKRCVVMFIGAIEPVVYGEQSKARYYVLDQSDGKQLVVEMWVDPIKAFDEQVKVFEKIVAAATLDAG